MSCEHAAMLKESHKIMKLTDAWVKIIVKVSDVTLEVSQLLLWLTVS